MNKYHGVEFKELEDIHILNGNDHVYRWVQTVDSPAYPVQKLRYFNQQNIYATTNLVVEQHPVNLQYIFKCIECEFIWQEVPTYPYVIIENHLQFADPRAKKRIKLCPWCFDKAFDRKFRLHYYNNGQFVIDNRRNMVVEEKIQDDLPIQESDGRSSEETPTSTP